MTDIVLSPTRCAICRTVTPADEVHPANLDVEALSASVFSARRPPDRRHYRWVRCTVCSLLRSDPTAQSDMLPSLYAESSFDYADEVASLRWSYRKVIEAHVPAERRQGSLLEVGGGSGFMLEEALDMGFREVAGVEPSRAAVAAANARVRDAMVCDVMRPGLFADDRFDVVCLFHVVDHLPDPVEVLRTCRDVLRPGGVLLFVVHDEQALSARVLGRRSPIVDVEHTYLYSRRTATRLLETAGFVDARATAMVNRYSLAYLTQLAPLPAPLKAGLVRHVPESTLRRQVTVRLGNLAAVGSKAGGSGA